MFLLKLNLLQIPCAGYQADDPSRGDSTLSTKLGFADVSEKACACLRALCLSVAEQLAKMADNKNPFVKRTA